MNGEAINYGVLQDNWEVNCSVGLKPIHHYFLASLIFLTLLGFVGLVYALCIALLYINSIHNSSRLTPQKFQIRPSHISQICPPNGVVDIVKVDFYQICFHIQYKFRNRMQSIYLFHWDIDRNSWRRLRVLLINKNNYL